MTLLLSEIHNAAARLGLEPCALRAVLAVESKGSGFLPDGRVKILFEGHIFWKELKKRGINPATLAAAHPDILYPRWNKAHYRGGAAEWGRLDAAIRINREAALCSASYGLFQIMGFNHRACGFDDVRDFVSAHSQSEARQLDAFCAFMRTEGLIPFLRVRDWAGFARRYNGPGYAANQYDAKLSRAYEQCKNSS